MAEKIYGGRHSGGARRIVLCADDYGLAPGVSRAIRELLTMRRLSATSCMTVFPDFLQEGPLLRPFLDRADIGLHFTLTVERPLSSVIVDGWLYRLDPKAMRSEVDRQIAIFTSAMKRPPAYIDGHQYVHLLPGAREAVADAARRTGAYVRSTQEPVNFAMLRRPAPVESAYLSLAAAPFAKLTRRSSVRTNSGYRGARSFREKTPYRDLFRRMISGAANGSIVVCHPGFVDDTLVARDRLTSPRENEFAYLASGAFPEDLAEAGLELATLREALAQT